MAVVKIRMEVNIRQKTARHPFFQLRGWRWSAAFKQCKKVLETFKQQTNKPKRTNPTDSFRPMNTFDTMIVTQLPPKNNDDDAIRPCFLCRYHPSETNGKVTCARTTRQKALRLQQSLLKSSPDTQVRIIPICPCLRRSDIGKFAFVERVYIDWRLRQMRWPS